MCHEQEYKTVCNNCDKEWDSEDDIPQVWELFDMEIIKGCDSLSCLTDEYLMDVPV